MKRKVLLVIVVMFVFALTNVDSAFSLCDEQSCGDQYCDQISSLWNVPVYHNGEDCIGRPGGIGMHQCVALFKRIETKIFKNPIGWVGVARNIYIGGIDSEDELQVFTNGATNVPPLPGYHLVYDDSSHSVGHVGTFKDLKNKEGVQNEWKIGIVEQNWPSGGEYDGHTLTRSSSNTYSINPRGSYTVLGWVRNPALEFVGKYEDGFRVGDNRSEAFAYAYGKTRGELGFDLGDPWDNSYADGPVVHCWPDDCSSSQALYVQDFLNAETSTWSMLVRNPFDEEDEQGVYLVAGCVLDEWFWHWGYSNYGPPTEDISCDENGYCSQEFELGYVECEGNSLVFDLDTEETFVFQDDYGIGCGGEPPQDPEIEPGPLAPDEVKMCSDVQYDWPLACLEEETRFVIKDSQDICAYAWVGFTDIYDEMHLRWDWYDWNGWFDSTDYVLPDPGDGYYPEVPTWGGMCFVGDCQACDYNEGFYRVELKAYDQSAGSWDYLATYFFDILYPECVECHPELEEEEVFDLYTLNPSRITLRNPEIGPNCYLYSQDLLVPHENDKYGSSILMLFEDDVLLGPAHSTHNTIAVQGRGMYSDWGTYLYFSTPDNTDPRTNGRTYTVKTNDPYILNPNRIVLRSSSYGSNCYLYSQNLLASHTNDHEGDSGLILYEDGISLGPANILHNDISKYGRGRYSDWRSYLYFSTPDNTDPRTNGRMYTIEIQ